MRKFLLLTLGLWMIGILAAPIEVSATPLNSWKVSCGVDKGAITHKGKTWTFKTSTNHCPGGIFKQRAEIYSGKIQPNRKGAYLFTTLMSLTSSKSATWDVFQIHDGRRGCAPPLKVTVMASGQMELHSDIKTGPGESCIRGKLTNARSKGRIRRDGTEQKLDILIEFDGQGGFHATIWLDGVAQLQGQYKSPNNPGAFQSEHFYFKHGVYSQHAFSYVLVSRNMKVKKVKAKR